MSSTHERPLFREEQAFVQWWIWAVVLIVALLAWWAFVEQIVFGRPFGSNPVSDGLVWGIFVLCGLALPLFFLRSRLVTTVTPGRLEVHFRLLRRRVFEIRRIASAQPIHYRPIRQFGGWGIRYNRQLGWAYTARGREGVHLVLDDGTGFLVGSQRSGELIDALHEAGLGPAAEEG